MKRSMKLLPTILLGVVFLLGAGVLAYPTLSDRWNRRVQSRAVASYNASVESLSEQDYSSFLKGAKDYNARLLKAGSANALSHPESVAGYEETLNVDRSGVIGSISIDKINVELPIYHGTSADVLTAGAGHLQGTSLPIGGESTHSVISAHRGLPRARLFTDLDRLEVGDRFRIQVLGERLYYEVDQVRVVLPSDMQELYIQKGRDLCTLMTCTPYGINTHRLLVRGHRIFVSEEETRLTEEAAEEKKGHTPLMILLLIAAALIVVWLLLKTHKRGKKYERTKYEKEI